MNTLVVMGFLKLSIKEEEHIDKHKVQCQVVLVEPKLMINELCKRTKI